MLQLKNITKIYELGSTKINALNGVNLQFREAEFVSILGQSGCGKTTMLNIIGGLDKYTSGDLLVEGKSTKDFKDGEWDAYRNSTIGFVFQSYNLISHLTVLDNVAIALTLSGVSAEARKKKASDALAAVGLSDQINKKPNQLSGGQMQRVAIARALVNDPKILMADEPTGALDSMTSVQIMEILKEVSKKRLVIMVTHNQELAKEYSDRIVKLKDGLVIDDTRPCDTEIEIKEKLVNKKTSMSWWTAIKLSFKNLMTKKKRTILTAIAGSIGIIGVALVLAISSGMTTYVNGMQSNTLSGYPISISKSADVVGMGDDDDDDGYDILSTTTGAGAFPGGDTINSYDPSANTKAHINILTQDYIDYLNAMDKTLYNSISYSYDLEMTVIAKDDSGAYKKVDTRTSLSLFDSSGYFSEIPGDEEFITSQYDILENGGRFPSGAGEVALVIDKYNRLDVKVLQGLGIAVTESYKFSDLLGRTFKVIDNNDLYTESGGVYTVGTNYEAMYNSEDSFAITVVGIMRIKESSSSQLLLTGIGYTAALTQRTVDKAKVSEVAKAQIIAGETVNVLTGLPFNSKVTLKSVMQKIGADTIPASIRIYPVNFEAKSAIKTYLNAYNAGRPAAEQIVYTDMAESMTSMFSTMISAITMVLTAFAAISLIVSTIMIGIITYVSVVERTKEIGILRAIGARKKDITRIFNAETLIIGFVSGLLGVLVTLLLSIPINIIVKSLIGVSGIASLPILYAFILVAGSMVLTLIGGFIPSRGAAKKDPVVALRTE